MNTNVHTRGLCLTNLLSLGNPECKCKFCKHKIYDAIVSGSTAVFRRTPVLWTATKKHVEECRRHFSESSEVIVTSSDQRINLQNVYRLQTTAKGSQLLVQRIARSRGLYATEYQHDDELYEKKRRLRTKSLTETRG
jgi:hypothetical protein